MLPIMKLYTLFCSVILLQSFHEDITNASTNSHQSYFEKRKAELKNMKVTYIKRPKTSQIPKEYYENPQLYKYNFKRLINEPNLCSQHEKIFLLYVIRTIYSHFSRRQIQRKIIHDIPNDIYSKKTIIKHVFLFGKTKNSTVESSIQKESKEYRDIIQEDYLESYANVSLKTIMAWKWSVEFCANTDYVIVMNDELFIDQYKLVRYLYYDLTLDKHNDRFAVCYVTGNSKTNYKYFARKHMDMSTFYEGDHYPWFCHGVGYVASINFINKLYIASLSNRFFMPDDAWNGLLAEKLNVSLKRDNNNMYALKEPLEKFSHPLYEFNQLMFLVTDYRTDVSHVVLKQISDILKIQRPQYHYKMPETLVIRGKKDVAGEKSLNFHNLVLKKNKLNNLVKNSLTYEHSNVCKYIFIIMILTIIFKSLVLCSRLLSRVVRRYNKNTRESKR